MFMHKPLLYDIEYYLDNPRDKLINYNTFE
mgnify:CR=1 FL=1